MSELTGVSARTIQHWRKVGFFEPAIPAEWVLRYGYTPGEIYSLADVLAVKVIDIFRATPMPRAVLEKLAPDLSFWHYTPRIGHWCYSPREFNLSYGEEGEDNSPLWCTVPLEDFDNRDAEIKEQWPRSFFESELRALGIPVDQTSPIELDDPRDGSRALLLPIGDIALEIVEKADRWRLERGIKRDSWPHWN